jgi:hypothetical protein
MKLFEAIEIAALDGAEIAVEPWTWPFAQARARENRVLRGASFET